MSDVTIRRAEPTDAAAIHELIVALAVYEREPDAVETTPAVLEAQLREPHPPFRCLLAERGGRAVGFALWCRNYSTWRGRPGIWLEDLFVREEERGRGTGAALLREVAAVAVAEGAGRLEFAVLDWNEPARGFYRALGARPMDEWTVFRVTDSALARLAAGPDAT